MINKTRHLSDYIDSLQENGKYVFDKNDALEALQCTNDAFRSSIKRLTANRRVATLSRNFYQIIPIEYKNLETLPPEWYIDNLMKHLDVPYYVCLLTAATYHGASHQASQVYHVIIDKILPSIFVGRSEIRFHKNSLLSYASTTFLKVPTGKIKISSPEQTAFDLVKYATVCGGINHISTVLSELQEVIDADKLLQIAQQKMPLSVSQRIGYILDILDASEIVKPLKEWVKNHKKRSLFLLNHPLNMFQTVKI